MHDSSVLYASIIGALARDLLIDADAPRSIETSVKDQRTGEWFMVELSITPGYTGPSLTLCTKCGEDGRHADDCEDNPYEVIGGPGMETVQRKRRPS